MEGSLGPSDLQKQLKEREAEVGILRDRLGQAQEEIDRLRRENSAGDDHPMPVLRGRVAMGTDR